MYGRVLVPLDGSELAEAALRFAELIPSRTVRLITVEPVKLTAARNRWAREEFTPSGASWLVPSASAYLNLIAIPFREKGRDIEVVTTTGKPGQRIIDASADADLIVMAIPVILVPAMPGRIASALHGAREGRKMPKE